jgi:hypothetical protein
MLTIGYLDGAFAWGGYVPSYPEIGFRPNSEVTPTTFVPGKYPVIIYTEKMLPHRFEVEAKFSKTEAIHGFKALVSGNLGEWRVGNQGYCLPDVIFILEMGQDSITYIYSIDIGNLSLKFAPPVLRYTDRNDLLLIFEFGDYVQFSTFFTEVIPNQPLTVPIFRIGETYMVTMQTIANNIYTTLITMTK